MPAARPPLSLRLGVAAAALPNPLLTARECNQPHNAHLFCLALNASCPRAKKGNRGRGRATWTPPADSGPFYPECLFLWKGPGNGAEHRQGQGRAEGDPVGRSRATVPINCWNVSGCLPTRRQTALDTRRDTPSAY